VVDDRPGDWNFRRKSVYARDNYTCQNCGARGGSLGDAELQAHHVVPRLSGGTDKKTNLKTLCSECHKAVHGNATAPTAGGSNTENQEEASFFELMQGYTETLHRRNKRKYGTKNPPYGDFHAKMTIVFLIILTYSTFTSRSMLAGASVIIYLGVSIVLHFLEKQHRID
jgi:hypothetical protein